MLGNPQSNALTDVFGQRDMIAGSKRRKEKEQDPVSVFGNGTPEEDEESDSS